MTKKLSKNFTLQLKIFVLSNIRFSTILLNYIFKKFEAYLVVKIVYLKEAWPTPYPYLYVVKNSLRDTNYASDTSFLR